MNQITEKTIVAFSDYLTQEEKANATMAKYLRDIRTFFRWLEGKEMDKRAVIQYKSYLIDNYALSSANSMLSSLNTFFSFLDRRDCCIKTVKTQRNSFLSNEKELNKYEYERLLIEARMKHNERLYFLLQTICSTGIRVSELQYITVEAVAKEHAEIMNKGKYRTVFLPRLLCKKLKAYCKANKVKSGPVFVSKNGNPLDRSNIWSDMKKLCRTAGVSEKKAFPHNLRHLFAREFYSQQKDIVHLADILGHSNVNTTRIYTMESGEVHRQQIQKLGLLR